MELSERDLAVLKLTRTFSQVASTHLTELLFEDRSHSVPDKVLGRLVRLGYLSRVGRRATGSKGGAGTYVYQLGRAGRLLLEVDGRLSPNVNNHALMMADTYLELRRAEKAGLLAVTDWEVERRVPPSVRADLYVSLDFPSQGRSSSFFLEVDLSTEQPARIREKVAGYWRAVEMSTADYFPYVVFVVKDLVRRSELARLFRQLPAEQQEMVRVCVWGKLVSTLSEA
ncbi:replication-relaxation family protein [Streptomyces sp. DvalAA-19]|uniref:replication-relaxation family protein n=1 Tax=Streptomyces sp. DvalAA-19 TaxID=1839761 RepID=UPI00081B4326|nr:replication-relaxation family protein [Streptomyces sp. DvalAA-19]SCE18158.1 Replication-relaxation [Streptomyces sp. DvalAA-19]